MSNATSSPRRLYRSRRDKVIGGVCGGLGGYFSIDPVVVRVLWLALILFGGTGVLAYIIAWILIPEAPDADRDPGRVERSSDGGRLLGVVLIVLALIWIGSLIGFYNIHHFPWQWLGPLALVALGIALLLRRGVHDAAERHEQEAALAPMGGAPAKEQAAGQAGAGTGAAAAEDTPTDSEASAPAEDADSAETEEPKPAAGDDSAAEGDETSSSDEDKGEDDASKKPDEGERPFERRPLRRSVTDRVIGGVCGGLARYFGMDSTAMRLLFALVTLGSVGLGLVAYVVLWIAIREEEF